MCLRICRCFKSANHKKVWVLTAKPQRATFSESPQIEQIMYVRKFVDLRFAKLICGPPTFVNL
jgi:hypothetical protein